MADEPATTPEPRHGVVVIPTCNERENLAPSVRQILSSQPHLDGRLRLEQRFARLRVPRMTGA
jgi:hypothetical protein